MSYRVLIEASGSLVSGYLMKAIKESGNICIGSDIEDFNHAKCICDDFIVFPLTSDKKLWEKVEKLLLIYNIDIVIPSFDEMLLGWAERKDYFLKKGIYVIVSDKKTIEIFNDKYNTYRFCKQIGIPVPKTSLSHIYSLVKPRKGRGGKDIYIGNEQIEMNNMISQEFIEGKEYTVDCFFNIEGEPIYIIPRLRMNVKNGKATKGIVVKNNIISNYIRKISAHIKLIGPINFQFIEKNNNEIYLIECNPRIAGGMALGFAASENWINLIIENIINKKPIKPQNIKYGLKMVRYYNECFFF